VEMWVISVPERSSVSMPTLSYPSGGTSGKSAIGGSLIIMRVLFSRWLLSSLMHFLITERSLPELVILQGLNPSLSMYSALVLSFCSVLMLE
jgi:hypothetical protein